MNHHTLALETGEIVLFTSFVERGLALPKYEFLRGLLHYYSIALNHLNPNSILHLSILGIPSYFTLFHHFFRLKP